MDKHTFKRFVSITAALALTCSSFAGAGILASADNRSTEAPRSCDAQRATDALEILQISTWPAEACSVGHSIMVSDNNSGRTAEYLLKASIELETWTEQFDYSVLYEAKPDANGCFTLEYNITDTTAFHIAAIDRAFNIAFLDYGDPAQRPTSVKPGIYRGKNGLYEFTEETVRYVPIAYPIKECTYYYFETDYIENSIRLETEKNLRYDVPCFWSLNKVTGTPETGYHIDGSVPEMKEHPGDDLVLTDLTPTEGYLALSAYDTETSFIKPILYELTGCRRINNMQYDVSEDAVVTFTADCNTKSLDPIAHLSITVDMKTGIATLPDGSKRDQTKKKPLPLGDADCSGKADVADAVLVTRFLTEDKEAIMESKGIFIADVNRNGELESSDLSRILNVIAKKTAMD